MSGSKPDNTIIEGCKDNLDRDSSLPNFRLVTENFRKIDWLRRLPLKMLSGVSLPNAPN